MATIKDVAKLAGVSIATVSRVFNQHPLVSGPTRERVHSAATELNYWPNEVARSLITNRTQALGVLLPDLHGEFFSELIRGVDLTAREFGYHLLFSRTSARPDALMTALRTIRGRVDGLIVMAPDVDAHDALKVCAGRTPTVLLDPEVSVGGCHSLSIANADGARQMTEHLLALGHRRIAMITGPDKNIDAQQRLAGHRAALAAAGAAHGPELEVRGDFTERSGYDAMQSLLASRMRPDAVFVANDHMAVGALCALQDAELRVPDDLALVGFDDIPIARYLTPPLTTVRVDTFDLGARAVHLLVRQSQVRPGRKHHEVLPTQLVVRRSCGSTASSVQTVRQAPHLRPARD